MILFSNFVTTGEIGNNSFFNVYIIDLFMKNNLIIIGTGGLAFEIINYIHEIFGSTNSKRYFFGDTK